MSGSTVLPKPETDGLPTIDVRQLARTGLRSPLTVRLVSEGLPIVVEVTEDAAGRPSSAIVAYTYAYRLGRRIPESVRDEIQLTRTGCHYGGERVWFVCPGCLARRAVLRMHRGRFRCTACHGLAYSSTRERGMLRAARRGQKLQQRLAGGSSLLEPMPSRPKGMHRRTYRRLTAAIDERKAIVAAGIVETAAAIEARFSGLHISF
jgi:hypothetical protein